MKTLSAAFKATIPVLLGYLAIGVAFGLLLIHAGYPWYLSLIMSVLIYAGAGQYIAVGLFASNAGLADIATVTLLVNARHMVYGLSLIDSFKGTGCYKPYLIFALTDETYALLTTVAVPEGVDRKRFYFDISILDQSYWVAGSVLGALIGAIIPINTEGLDFALTALFVVLLIEQYKACDRKFPFLIAGVCSIAALILIGPANMLIVSIAASVFLLFLLRRFSR
jgi:4-azaleucine resistance transporter AzlC